MAARVRRWFTLGGEAYISVLKLGRLCDIVVIYGLCYTYIWGLYMIYLVHNMIWFWVISGVGYKCLVVGYERVSVGI